ADKDGCGGRGLERRPRSESVHMRGGQADAVAVFRRERKNGISRHVALKAITNLTSRCRLVRDKRRSGTKVPRRSATGSAWRVAARADASAAAVPDRVPPARSCARDTAAAERPPGRWR